MLGVYTTEEAAAAVVASLRLTPGFCDHPYPLAAPRLDFSNGGQHRVRRLLVVCGELVREQDGVAVNGGAGGVSEVGRRIDASELAGLVPTRRSPS